jgi:hypothetical protein
MATANYFFVSRQVNEPLRRNCQYLNLTLLWVGTYPRISVRVVAAGVEKRINDRFGILLFREGPSSA